MPETGNPDSPPTRLKTPGPIWLWIVAAIVFTQVVKRLLITWPIPKAEDFHFGSRFLENLVANLILGIPVLLLFLICLWWVNRGRSRV